VDSQISANEKNSTSLGVTYPGRTELLAASNLFLFNEKNRAFIEDQTRRIRGPTWEGNRLHGFLLLLVFVFVGIPLLSGSDGLVFLLLKVSNKTTEGTVIDGRTGTRIGERGHHTTTYFLSYSFIVGGKEYSNEDEVDEDVYDRLKPGSQVKVAYFPGDPDISNISTFSLTDSLCLTVLMLVVIGWTILFVMFQAYRHHRLSKYGQLLRGDVLAWEVAEKKAFGRSETVWKVSVKYRFTTPAGQTVSAIKRFSLNKPSWLMGERGSPVAVIYVNEKLYDLL
jgi:hypothetical protein